MPPANGTGAASPAEIRAWARTQEDLVVPDRGQLPPHVRDAYAAAHGAAGAAPGPLLTDLDDVPPLTDTGETPPAAPRRPRGGGGAAAARSWRDRLTGRGKPKGKSGGRKPAPKPRVPVEELIAGVWRGMARLAAPVPPLQRTLRVQAPVAGLLLEDTVKGTVLDTFMQPVARWMGGGKIATAILGPPAIVTGLSLHIARAAAAGREPNPILLQAGYEALRSALMVWLEISGPAFERAIAREAEFEQKYGADVDAFIGWLMSPPVNPADDAAVAAEEMMLRRVRGHPVTDDGAA